MSDNNELDWVISRMWSIQSIKPNRRNGIKFWISDRGKPMLFATKYEALQHIDDESEQVVRVIVKLGFPR